MCLQNTPISSLRGSTLDVFVYLSFELKGFFFPQCVLTFMEFFFLCRHFQRLIIFFFMVLDLVSYLER